VKIKFEHAGDGLSWGQETPMLQLVYASAAARGLTPSDIDNILAKARTRNAAMDLTGVLLYAGDNFLQVLEGPDAAVEQVFSAIKKDQRHTGLMTLLRRQVPARNFQNWSMGFERVEREKYPDLDAAFDIGRAAIKNRLTGSEGEQIMAFLSSFYTINTRQQF
jgi:hypothetical protein